MKKTICIFWVLMLVTTSAQGSSGMGLGALVPKGPQLNVGPNFSFVSTSQRTTGQMGWELSLIFVRDLKDSKVHFGICGDILNDETANIQRYNASFVSIMNWDYLIVGAEAGYHGQSFDNKALDHGVSGRIFVNLAGLVTLYTRVNITGTKSFETGFLFKVPIFYIFQVLNLFSK